MNDTTKSSVLMVSASLCAIALIGMFANQLLAKPTGAPSLTQQSSSQAPNVVVQPLVVLPSSASPAGSEQALGGLIHNTQESFDGGISVNGTEVITSAGAFKLGSGSTAIDKSVRTTVAIDVASMSPISGTSSVITLTGASVGDHCSVEVTAGDFYSTTSTGRAACMITSANTATAFFNNASSGTFNAGASTFSLQAWSY